MASNSIGSVRSIGSLWQYSGGVDQNTTWLWDQVGATWTQLSTAQSPPAREGAGITYDAALDRVILFGGQDTNESFNDTWELSPTSTPTPTPIPHRYTYTNARSVSYSRAQSDSQASSHATSSFDPAMIPHLSDFSLTIGRGLDGIIPVTSIHSLSRFVD